MCKISKAGTRTVLFSGPDCWFMIQKQADIDREEHLERLRDHNTILIEGVRQSDYPSITIHRRDTREDRNLSALTNKYAVVSDDATVTKEYPILDFNTPHKVANFICTFHRQPSP
ncbi:MAG: molybdopterin-guanine dinucleotide biosynthesis protein MobB [Magnetococcales bacterium]|nr:molybdopterin-guanine dinucleotide biosynthesis protein MobB [Magnetococcales bacterium]